MRIVAISFGTEGDTRPIVALCRGLMEAGHETRMLAECSGAALAKTAGVPFITLAGDIRGALTELLSGRADSAQTEALSKIAKKCTSVWMKTLVEQARGSDAVLFSGLASYVALSVAEHLSVPVIGAGLQPAAATREFPSPFLPWQVPSWCNRLSHRFVMNVIWRAFRDAINAARAEVTQQPPRRRAWRGYPFVLGMSPYLVPQPADWPDYQRITGYWHLDTNEWQPPQALAEFLSAGERPIYIGFGSMTGFDHRSVMKTAIAALNGRRALLSSGWSGIDSSGLPPNVFPIGPAPHDHLFRLVSMVVHHGGVGTSHTAARAGVPSIVVPFAGDQFFWATRLATVGIAPEPIPHKSLDANVLGQRIRQAESESIRHRAARMGEVMRAESGVATAITAIESFVRGKNNCTMNASDRIGKTDSYADVNCCKS